jgi:hypothetical protein
VGYYAFDCAVRASRGCDCPARCEHPGCHPRGRAASVSVDPGAAIGPIVPGDFLGLSFEASSLPYVARAMASDLSGLHFHDLIAEPDAFSPLAAGDAQEFASGALHANPEWYALLLARHLIGDRPVQARATSGCG